MFGTHESTQWKTLPTRTQGENGEDGGNDSEQIQCCLDSMYTSDFWTVFSAYLERHTVTRRRLQSTEKHARTVLLV